MKITLEIPDNTVCAVFNFVYGDYSELMMHSRSIGSFELKDGSVIKIKTDKK